MSDLGTILEEVQRIHRIWDPICGLQHYIKFSGHDDEQAPRRLVASTLQSDNWMASSLGFVA